VLFLSTRSISRMKGLGEASSAAIRPERSLSAGRSTMARVPRPIIYTHGEIQSSQYGEARKSAHVASISRGQMYEYLDEWE
jgi:hypothetical protein